jgi:hypothetical protein
MKPFIIKFKDITDIRGSLTSIEGTLDIPFEIKRIFYMHNIKEDRGGHAHIQTDQIIIPVNGTFKVKLFDGINSTEYIMNDCSMGLYVPRLTYTDLYDFSNDAVCLVLANTHYDMSKSLRSMNDFLNYVKQ